MHKHIDREALHRAERGAAQVRERLGLGDKGYEILVIGGTGWSLPGMDREHGDIPFKKVDHGFRHLTEHPDPDHRRVWTFGKLHDKRCIFANGRVHLNDDPDYPQYHRPNVRAQVEVPIALGVKTIIATAAVGNVNDFGAGDVCVVRNFLSFHPIRLLGSGEFTSVSEVLDPRLQTIALKAAESWDKNSAKLGVHVFFLGPDFETDLEKRAAAKLGGNVAGMSIRPELTVASLYSENERGGVRGLGLCYLTNNEKEIPSHKKHKDQAAKDMERNAQYLSEIIKQL